LLALFAMAFTTDATAIDADAGSRGFKFLQFIFDARTVGTAWASASVRAANPAALTDEDGVGFFVSHTEWLSSIRLEHFGMVLPMYDGVAGIRLQTQSSGDIPLRVMDTGSDLVGIPLADPNGTYGVYDVALSLAYGRHLFGLDWGMSAKLIYEKIYLSSVTAIATDLGVRWQQDAWTAGAVVRNIGRSGKFRNERVALPVDALVGMTYSRPIGSHEIIAMADVRIAPDYAETAHVGAEATIADVLAVRLGYRVGLNGSIDGSGFTTGLGLRFASVHVDYAYIPSVDGLGAGHFIGLSVGR